jgi:Domain of unknown function (DUF5668)
MKPARFFYSFFLISTGTLFFLHNFGIISYFTVTTEIWPIILILWGLSSIVNNQIFKNIIASVSGIIASVILAGFIIDKSPDSESLDIIIDKKEQSYNKVDTLSIPYDSTIVKPANLNIDAGAAVISIKGGGTDQLLMLKRYINTDSSEKIPKSTFKILNKIFDGTHTIDLEFGTDIEIFKHNVLQTSEIRLHPNALWNINLQGGASMSTLDLSDYKIQSVSLESGVSSVYLKLGNLQEITKVQFEGGMSTFTAEIPESAGCRIHNESGLSANEFEGFSEISENVYETPGYAKAKQKIEMNIESGVSTIKVKRYKDIDSPKKDIVPNKESIKM